jgi:glycosyltransferase involved in cell wall biosynthesis
VSRVAIVTPAYRQARFIGPCIESVIAQTVQDWEMVVIDDGSDDGTADIAMSFREPRITVVQRPHEGLGGLGDAYALGIGRTSSPIVAVLEGDDMWPPTKLQDQLPFLDDTDVALVYGAAGLLDEHGCIYALHGDMPKGGIARNEPLGSIMAAIVRTDFIVTSTVLIRRSALVRVGGFAQPPGIPYVDVPTWLRLATVGRFARSPKVAGYWRRHAAQWTIQSTLAPPPPRTRYLTDIAAAAKPVMRASDWASLARAISRDESRQRGEFAITRGRQQLIAGEWSGAVSTWASLLRRQDSRTRLVALLGLVSSVLRIDMEWVIQLAGRHSLPSRRHQRSHR